MAPPTFTVPGMSDGAASEVISALDHRMSGPLDLTLTLKHIYWNVVGPNFIAVDEMLDPQVDAVRDRVDEIAERIATLGGIPVGTPGSLVERRECDDYELGRRPPNNTSRLWTSCTTASTATTVRRSRSSATSIPSPRACSSHSSASWSCRAHLESETGSLPTVDITSELQVAAAV